MTVTLAPTRPWIAEEDDLALVEAAGGDGPFNPDGTVNVVVIRPGQGRGPGQRVYTAPVLSRDAGVFKGWSMYTNHDTASARQQRRGIPRSPTDLAGVIRESWWDPTYTAAHDGKLGLGRGAVVARAALTEPMEALVRRIPEAIKLSVNAQATGLSKAPGKPGGALVEGIANDPETSSVDFVTRAGAGGEIRTALLESVNSRVPEGPSLTLVDALMSPEVSHFLATRAAPAREPIKVWATPPPTRSQQFSRDLRESAYHGGPLQYDEFADVDLPVETQQYLQVLEAAAPGLAAGARERALRAVQRGGDPALGLRRPVRESPGERWRRLSGRGA